MILRRPLYCMRLIKIFLWYLLQTKRFGLIYAIPNYFLTLTDFER